MPTIQETCQAAMELSGALAGGETATDDDLQRVYRSMRQMLDSWGAEREFVYVTTVDTFTATGAASYTIGNGTPTANIVSVRPNSVGNDGYITVNGASYGFESVGEQVYNDITNKTITGYPRIVFYKPTFPNGTLYFWPIPPVSMQVTLVSAKPILSFDTLPDISSQLLLPPGYQRAIEYSLAEEIEGIFNAPLPQTLSRIAAKARRNIKRINAVDRLLYCPTALLSPKGTTFNIATGLGGA